MKKHQCKKPSAHDDVLSQEKYSTLTFKKFKIKAPAILNTLPVLKVDNEQWVNTLTKALEAEGVNVYKQPSTEDDIDIYAFYITRSKLTEEQLKEMDPHYSLF